MTWVKSRIAAAFVVIATASLVTLLQVEANRETDDQVGEEAVWNPADTDLSAISQACKSQEAAGFSDCFIEQMGGYASSNAVAFAQLLASQKSPRLGYLAGIRESGLVDLGYVMYTGNSEQHPGWVLMNGIPTLVSLDDVAILPKSEMQKDSQYIALHKNHPQLQLIVNDDQRKADASPQIQALPDGGERFVIPYSLQEPCAGCGPLARANFAFDFNGGGKLMAVRFLRVESGQP
ncbi:MAG: Chagasin family peptidase inhibitor [Candidatus Angelobacter sp.]|jgi:hypothetical protein|nr:Chagasin family peptidase inhibitor [Candidatus Angelobacter sp.]